MSLAKDLKSALFTLHDKPERWDGLAQIEHKLTDRQFFDVFVWVWTDSESNDLYLETIDRLIDKRGVVAKVVMPALPAAERKWFDALPDEFTVYRGTALDNPYCDYSWSTDRDKAVWFAMRGYDCIPALATGVVDKRDILFSYKGRGESEIAVRTNMVRYKTLTQIGSYQKNDRARIFFAAQQGLLLPAYSPEMLAFRLRAQREGIESFDIEGSLRKQIEYLQALGFSETAKRRSAALEQALSQLVA